MEYQAKNLTQAFYLVLDALGVSEETYEGETDLVHLIELMATGLATKGESKAK